MGNRHAIHGLSSGSAAFVALVSRSRSRSPASKTVARTAQLRHSAGTFLNPARAPRVVMEILGHRQIAVTMNTYGHVLLPEMKDAVASMDQLFNGRQVQLLSRCCHCTVR
ncbi:MAG: hypothetical protein E6I27_18245 [Chloroflexi bacterium]|nr:MAG: hypothetical protein E6I96_13225 [Chloroflexota bacterium]TMF33990.1 MAG: hypothetical protein E6I27_18245 [Chloroflexota bacterium]